MLNFGLTAVLFLPESRRLEDGDSSALKSIFFHGLMMLLPAARLTAAIFVFSKGRDSCLLHSAISPLRVFLSASHRHFTNCICLAGSLLYF